MRRSNPVLWRNWIASPNGRRFAERDLPSDDIAGYVAGRVSAARWRLHAEVIVHAPVALVSARINPAVGTVVAIDDSHCLLTTGADNVETLAVYLGLVGQDFTVTGPPELIDHLRQLADQYLRATSSAQSDR